MGVETSQKLARVLERKHYLLMSAQVEKKGSNALINKKNKVKKRTTESRNFKFEPATTFSTSFPNDAITLRIFVSILLPFWCISDYLFCRFVQSLALVGHQGWGHIGVSKWREEL